MARYRVKVESFVVVDASNLKQAKERGENAVRKSVSVGFTTARIGAWQFFADSWDGFAFQAVGKPEKLADDD